MQQEARVGSTEHSFWRLQSACQATKHATRATAMNSTCEPSCWPQVAAVPHLAPHTDGPYGFPGLSSGAVCSSAGEHEPKALKALLGHLHASQASTQIQRQGAVRPGYEMPLSLNVHTRWRTAPAPACCAPPGGTIYNLLLEPGW